MPEEPIVVPPEGGGHPPNPLIRGNSLEEALRQDPQKKKSAVLVEIVSQIDELLRKATDDGIIWGASVSIVGDLDSQSNRLYLPITRQNDPPNVKNKKSMLRRNTLVGIASLMGEGNKQVMEFFRREMEVRILPDEAGQSTEIK